MVTRRVAEDANEDFPFHPLQAAICGYTAYRAVHDLRNGHKFAGAFNAYLAAHHCPRVTH